MLRVPAPGLKVRDPRTRQIIGPEGVEVPHNDVRFERLIRDGALVAPPAQKAEAPAPAKAAAAAPAQTSQKPAEPAKPAEGA